MTYEIGQQVETPLGVGTVTVMDKDLKGNTLIAVNIGKLPVDYIGLVFKESDIKPYKTAHEKLVEKDFNYEYNECNDELSDKVHTYYNPKRYIKIEVTVTPNGVGWYTHFYDSYNYIANLELLEIIKQLVEEMAE